MTYDANVETVPDGSSVKVTWNALEGVDGVQIYRSESPDSGFASVGTSIGTSFTDSTVSMGKTYYYKLKAYKMLDGQKTFFNPSNIVSATILPSAPTNFKAEDALSSTRLSWTAVPNIEGYYVFRSESPDKDFVAVSRQKGTSFTNTLGLTSGKTYHYKVKPYNTVNGKNELGTAESLPMPGAIKNPSRLVVEPGRVFNFVEQ